MKKKPSKEDLDITFYEDTKKFRIKVRTRFLWFFSQWVELEHLNETKKLVPIELDTLDEAFELIENISE